MATLSRSLFLLHSFGYEQSDPAYFYGNLAEDTAQFIASLYSDRVVGGAPAAALHNARILDVGGGPGFFSEAFTARGSTYITVEPDVGEMAAANIEVPGSVRGSGDALPFADASFDIVYSSNVAEHMPNPWDMGDEMLRVTRPGGLVVLSYTIWLGPFGGHETGLWQHYIGGNFARNLYTRTHGHPPKNVFGESLFDVSCAGLPRPGIRHCIAGGPDPPLPSPLGVVAGACSRCPRVSGEQPGHCAAQKRGERRKVNT